MGYTSESERKIEQVKQLLTQVQIIIFEVAKDEVHNYTTEYLSSMLEVAMDAKKSIDKL